MTVAELKELLNQADDNDDVSIYNLTTGNRIYFDISNIDFSVRNHFEINIEDE